MVAAEPEAADKIRATTVPPKIGESKARYNADIALIAKGSNVIGC
jgi:hypothetical protein